MKLKGIQIPVNSIRKSNIFFQESLNLPLFGHKDYKTPIKFSRTKYKYQHDSFELILYNKWKTWFEWFPKTSNILHIERENPTLQTFSNKFQFQINITPGTIDKITQIDICVPDIHKTKDFYVDHFKMSIFTETPEYIVLGYDESPRIGLIKKKSTPNCEFIIQGLENEVIDPNGIKFRPYDEYEGGYHNEINLTKRSWLLNSLLVKLCFIISFIYMIDDKRPYRRVVFLIKKYFEFD